MGVPGRPSLRARVCAGDRASGARTRDDGLVEGGARPEGLHRLQPERARPHDRFGVFGASAPRCGGLRPGHMGRAARRGDRGFHPGLDAGALRLARRRAGRDRRQRSAISVPCSSGSSARRRPEWGKRRTRRTSPRCRASHLASSPRAAASREGSPGTGLALWRLGRQGRSRSPTVGPPASRGGRSSAHVHALGSLSGRKRNNLVPCRKRRPCTLS